MRHVGIAIFLYMEAALYHAPCVTAHTDASDASKCATKTFRNFEHCHTASCDGMTNVIYLSCFGEASSSKIAKFGNNMLLQFCKNCL